jgi:kumamolisin
VLNKALSQVPIRSTSHRFRPESQVSYQPKKLNYMRTGNFEHRAPARTVVATAALVSLGLLSSGAFALGGGLGGAPAPATAATHLPADARIVDLGVAPATDVRSVTVTLAVRNKAALDTFVTSLATPGSANYRKFITPAQFAATYGQTPAAVAQVVAYLQSQGLSTRVHANNLGITATGTNAQLSAAFGTAIHSYSLDGATYQSSTTAAVLPSSLAGIATSVAGLSTQASLHSHAVKIPNTGALAGDVAATVKSAVLPPSGPGTYTVLDLAAKYNINPLYAKGLTGAGRTIGIATLAGYDQSDAYAYWNALGLAVSPTRITDVLVDGGPSAADGPGSEGAGETTLDIEQSGGVAPGADVRVYLAPNTNQGFYDVFAQAINDNVIDVLSVSWGSTELGSDQDTLDAFHTLFAQAAAQGIPVIAAAGDAGAYDINRSYTYPQCTTLLDVDFPASDSGVLAAGGTTLPNTVMHKHGPVTVPTERAWGWDYLKNYIVTYYGTDLYYASYFAVGGGGGVSVNVPRPSYQNALAGTQTSAPAQALLCDAAFLGAPGSGYLDLVDLPAGVAGRNLPDVSLNADPYSGYMVYQGGWGSGSGGTSFVAPQLNGILTLISSGLAGRIGAINPQLYAAFKAKGYSAGSPFKAITAGDNEYYKSGPTYNPSTGLGSLDVNALATALGVK